MVLPEAAALREAPFLLAPLGKEQLEDVIVRPARAAGIAFAPDVVRRLVDDTGSGEALPLLAFTLARLVDGLVAGDRVDLPRYLGIGGVHGALASQTSVALGNLARAGYPEAAVMTALMRFVSLDENGRPTQSARFFVKVFSTR
jgi:hypothetical protein